MWRKDTTGSPWARLSSEDQQVMHHRAIVALYIVLFFALFFLYFSNTHHICWKYNYVYKCLPNKAVHMLASKLYSILFGLGCLLLIFSSSSYSFFLRISASILCIGYQSSFYFTEALLLHLFHVLTQSCRPFILFWKICFDIVTSVI